METETLFALPILFWLCAKEESPTDGHLSARLILRREKRRSVANGKKWTAFRNNLRLLS
jgi:hypothetical protein